MKIYMFYQTFPQLEPLFYGYTKDRDRANQFKNIRSKLRLIVKNVKKDEYRDLKLKVPQAEIIPHEFITRGTIGTQKAYQLCTEREITEFLIHKEEILLRYLSEGPKIPIEIWNDDIREYLKTAGYSDMLKFSDDIIDNFDLDSLVGFDKFRIDELSLFLIKYQHTM